MISKYSEALELYFAAHAHFFSGEALLNSTMLTAEDPHPGAKTTSNAANHVMKISVYGVMQANFAQSAEQSLKAIWLMENPGCRVKDLGHGLEKTFNSLSAEAQRRVEAIKQEFGNDEWSNLCNRVSLNNSARYGDLANPSVSRANWLSLSLKLLELAEELVLKPELGITPDDQP